MTKTASALGLALGRRARGTAAFVVALTICGCRCESLAPDGPDPIPCLRRGLDLARRGPEGGRIAAAEEIVTATELTLQAIDDARERGCADALQLERARLAHTIAVFDRERLSAQPPEARVAALAPRRAHLVLRLATLLEAAHREHAQGALSVGTLLTVQHTTIETVRSLLDVSTGD